MVALLRRNPRQPSQWVRSARNDGAEHQQIIVQAIQDEKWERGQIAATNLFHDFRSGVEKVSRRSGRGFYALDGVIHFHAESLGKPVRNFSILRLKALDVFWKVRMIDDPHFNAARNSASVNPLSLPVTMSSIP